MGSHWHISKIKEAQDWNLVVSQLEYQPKTNTGHLKVPFIFCWLRNHLVYYSSLHVYSFDAVFKSVQHARLYQRLLRYEGIIRTSRPISKELKISWLMKSSWLMQESPVLKPDCFGDIKWFSNKKLSISL